MRIKSRYLLIRVIYDDNKPDPTTALAQLAKQISLSVEHYFGDYGMSNIRFGYQIKYFNATTGLGLIRVPRECYQLVVYAITQVKKLNGKQCKMDILHISGTIKKCQLIAIDLSRQYLKDQAFQLYLQSQQQTTTTSSFNTTTTTATTMADIDDTIVTNAQTVDVITLTNDGDIILDTNTLTQIASIETEIINIDVGQ